MAARRGSLHHKAKLTEDDVRDIRRRYATGEETLESIWHSYPQLENCWGTLYAVVTYRTWKHVDPHEAPTRKDVMRYICPICERPYRPSKRTTFPPHGKHWVVGIGWAWCDGANEEITEETKKYEPKPPKGRD